MKTREQIARETKDIWRGNWIQNAPRFHNLQLAVLLDIRDLLVELVEVNAEST
jgi:hypothetical protein